MLSRIMGFDLRSWAILPAYALLIIISVFPGIPALFYIRAFLLATILATVGVVRVKTGRAGLHPTVILWTYSLSALSFLFVLEGFFAGTPGASKVANIYVLWPLIYVLMLAGVRNKRILSGLIGTLMLSTICIGINSIVNLLIQTTVLPENHLFELLSFADRQAFDWHDDFIGMAYPGLNSLLFLAPFSLAALVTCLGRTGALFLNQFWLLIASSLGLLGVILSARRALYLGTLAAPLLTMLFCSFQPTAQRRVSRKALLRVTVGGVLAAAILLACLNLTYGVSLAGMGERLSAGFNFSATTVDEGANVRREQYHALLAGWMENPILGAGYGAPAFGSIRSESEPWNYELFYMALLYQTGLLGFAAYTAGIAWIYWMGVRVIRAGGYLSAMMVPCLVGMSSILVANATNPYFGGFDTMWPIFIPLAVVNFWLLRHNSFQNPRARSEGSEILSVSAS